jgi:glycosyltransferase involved in cell wall biosynthesis
MGWNWIINLAKHCRLFVITESEWEKEILDAVDKLPQRDNIKFYFNPVSEGVRKMCWNQGDWRFYFYYAKWQRKTLQIARQIVADNHIDVMHQLNMIGFREPGYLYKIKNIPLVWGPIGGMATIPTSFLVGAGWKQNIFNRVKNIISNAQIILHPRVRKMMRRSYPIAAVNVVSSKVKKCYGLNIPVINETGTDITETLPMRDTTVADGKLKVLWVGKFDFRKRLDIALKALSLTCNPNIELIVCGSGNIKQIETFRELAIKYGIDSQVEWLGVVDHEQILNTMACSDLLLFTSIAEATSTVVVEAITVGLPILSLNTCGFGALVDDFAGIAVPVTDPEQCTNEYAKWLNYLERNRNVLAKYTENDRKNVYKLSWEFKAYRVVEIYNEIIADVIK